MCRTVWRREVLDYQGKHYTLPYPGGTGRGKPLKLINRPVRDRIPIVIAALGPKNVERDAEVAEGWQPIFYFPDKAAIAWQEPIARGAARRGDDLPPLAVIAAAPLPIGDGLTDLRDTLRPMFALYIGGVGARGRYFFHHLALPLRSPA